MDHTHQTMVRGTAAQRRLVQDAFETWLPRILAYFGPPDGDTHRDSALYRFGLKVASNDAIRQEWLAKIIPVFEKLGVRVDPALTYLDEESGTWWYAAPDWAEVKTMLRDGGPRLEQWRSQIADSLERNAVYRDVSLLRSAA
jgi:ring-1,2-phenylacetyl-CoA epoxidase subunit PaaA